MPPVIPVVYEDNHVLVVIKPPNVPSQEDDSRDPDMLTLLKADLKRRYDKPGNVYLGLVHRLDRPVGGLMVFAKTSKAASRLSDAVRTRSIRKQYEAVVFGRPTPPQATLTHHVAKDAKTNRVSVVPASAPGAKEAVLDYRVVGSADGLSKVSIELHTGRPHQIRVQLAAIGCPLVGDQRYGGERAVQGQQIALWSVRLSFAHPTTREPLSFVCAPPRQFPWLLWESEPGAQA